MTNDLTGSRTGTWLRLALHLAEVLLLAALAFQVVNVGRDSVELSGEQSITVRAVARVVK